MEFILADFFFAAVGKTYLFVSLRNKAKINQVLFSKYDNSYTEAGRILCLRFFAWTFALVLLILLIVILFKGFFTVK
jgi:hypothetical protein